MSFYEDSVRDLDFGNGGYILLPKDGSMQYPVLYLFHGLGGCDEWIDQYHANILYSAETLVREGKMQPMIFVMPRIPVNASKMENPNMDTELALSAYEGFFNYKILDLIDYVNQTYACYVKTGRKNTAIAGFSMGATAAIYHAVKNVDTFYHLGAISVSTITSSIIKPREFVLDDPVRFIGYGTGEETKFTSADKYCIDNFEKNGVNLKTDTVGTGHCFDTFNPLLHEFFSKIFKN